MKSKKEINISLFLLTLKNKSDIFVLTRDKYISLIGGFI